MKYFIYTFIILLLLNKSQAQEVTGLTADSIENLKDIKDALLNLPVKPTLRIVFDGDKSSEYYKKSVTEIQEVSYVMGELLDSYDMKNYSVKDYKARTLNYLNLLGEQVDIWEIGNEVNGEWLGPTNEVVAKISSAYIIAKARKKITALTLYYNESCWELPEHEMFTWAQKNIPADIKQGLDYVWISYYEDDCNSLRPDWPDVFKKLGVMFPNSKIGFGEIGTKVSGKKEDYLRHYYSLKINHPRYVGGYFWWYFKQDMVPMTKPMWGVLNDILKKAGATLLNYSR